MKSYIADCILLALVRVHVSVVAELGHEPLFTHTTLETANSVVVLATVLLQTLYTVEHL